MQSYNLDNGKRGKEGYEEEGEASVKTKTNHSKEETVAKVQELHHELSRGSEEFEASHMQLWVLQL